MAPGDTQPRYYQIITQEMEKLGVCVGREWAGKVTPGFDLGGLATCSLACCWSGSSSPLEGGQCPGPIPARLQGVQLLTEGWGKLSQSSCTRPCFSDAQVGSQRPLGPTAF